MSAEDRSGRRVALAAVAGAHGVKGEVRLKLFTENPASLSAHKVLFLAGEQRRLLSLGTGGKMPIARFEGIDDRAAAEAARGSLVEADRDALPALAEGEYYYTDLIGLPCVDQQGEALGEVVSVENFGAGDLLEVRLDGGKTSLIPFKPGIADLEDGRIVLDREFLA